MDLNLRNVDPTIMQWLKECAARKGITLRDHCLNLLVGEPGPFPEQKLELVIDPDNLAIKHHPRCKCSVCAN